MFLHVGYYRGQARINNSKGNLAWRAKVYCLAEECFGFYDRNRDANTSIFYDHDTLVLNILFESKRDAKNFVQKLEKRSLTFSITSRIAVQSGGEKAVAVLPKYTPATMNTATPTLQGTH
jgi:hypothetical protein